MVVNTKNASNSSTDVRNEESREQFIERMIKKAEVRARERFADPALYVARKEVTEQQREGAKQAYEALLEYRKNRKWDTGPTSPSSLEIKSRPLSNDGPTGAGSDREKSVSSEQ